MYRIQYKAALPDLLLTADHQIDFPLMVCSHERSGTHFLINSLAACTAYQAKPWLDLDTNRLGGLINFRSPDQIAYFMRSLQTLDTGSGIYCCSNIIKNHHSSGYFYAAFAHNLRAAIILRHPAEVFLSYWRWLPSLPWHEADQQNSPLDLARSTPAGACLRYQRSSYSNHFARWANHAQDWVNTARQFPDRITITTYADLLEQHEPEMKRLASNLNLNLLQEPQRPDRHSNVVHGTARSISPDTWANLVEECELLLHDWPDLKALLRLSDQRA